jgi:hypothetical protein
MAMTIFFELIGMGVVFLLYVLANFWKEGHRPTSDARNCAREFGRRDWANVIVVTHPISHSAQGGLSVIPFQARDREPLFKPGRGTTAPKAMERPEKRISTR